MDNSPTCAHCGEVIGVYEPIIVVQSGDARETSRAAEPELARLTKCLYPQPTRSEVVQSSDVIGADVGYCGTRASRRGSPSIGESRDRLSSAARDLVVEGLGWRRDSLGARSCDDPAGPRDRSGGFLVRQ